MAGYSPWGRKESDMNEVTEHTHMYTINKTDSVFINSEFLKILALDIKKSNTNLNRYSYN